MNTTGTSRPSSSSTSKPSSFGICTSRNSRSGESSVTAFTASNPLPHSATSSTSAYFVRYSRTTARASGSSSTTTTRKGSRSLMRLHRGQHDLHPPHSIPLGGAQACLVAVKRLNPRADVRQADPRTLLPRPIGIARILDEDSEELAGARDRDPDRTSFEHVRHAMRNRVLDERLEQQWRHDAQLCPAAGHLRAEARAEPHALDIEKPLHQLELTPEGNAILAPEREALAKKLRQQQTHAARGGRIGRGQRADGLQAVEQEVRIDLRPQRSQLRFARQ